MAHFLKLIGKYFIRRIMGREQQGRFVQSSENDLYDLDYVR